MSDLATRAAALRLRMKVLGLQAAIQKAVWDESKHPRDQEGKFAEAFHGTAKANLKTILRDGLQLDKGVGFKDLIWTTRDPFIAALYADRKARRGGKRDIPIVLKVRVPEGTDAEEYATDGGVIAIPHSVPPEWIEAWGKVERGNFTVPQWNAISKSGGTVVYIPLTVSEDDDVLAKAWDESKHPRHPAGSEQGGEFASADAAFVTQYMSDNPYSNAIGLNGELRLGGELTEKEQQMAEAIDRVIADQAPLKEAMYFWRGAGEEVYPRDSFAVDPAFVSVTRNKDVASEFADAHSNGGGVLYQVRIPKGSKVLDAGAFQQHEGMKYQEEWILPRRAKFQRGERLQDYQGHEVFALNYIAPEINKVWDESKHPRDKRGRFTDSDLMGGLLGRTDAGEPWLTDQRPGVMGYVMNAYPLNRVLRGGAAESYKPDLPEDLARYQEITRRLDNSIAQSVLERPIIVYRSAGSFGTGLAEGAEITDPAFLSTTTAPEIAEDHSTHPLSTLPGRILRINVPKGAQALVVQGSIEHEVILPRNTRLRYIGGDEFDVVLDVNKALSKTFDPNQPRDKDGKWTRVLYRGTHPEQELTTPVSSGRFGAGLYLSQQPGVAGRYGSVVTQYESNVPLFDASLRFKSEKELAQLEDAVFAQLTPEEAARVREWWPVGGRVGTRPALVSTGEDVWEVLSRRLGQGRAQQVIRNLGYRGIEGIGDGAETVLFDAGDAIRKYDPNQPRDKDGKWRNTFHGTAAQNLEHILREGLTVGPRRNFPPDMYEGSRGTSVYVTTQQDIATFYAQQAARKYALSAGRMEYKDENYQPLIVEMHIPKEDWEKMSIVEDEHESSAFRVPSVIPPEYIVKAYTVDNGPAKVLFQKGVAAEDHVVLFAVVLPPEPVAKDFNESEHPRKPKGDPHGGEWVGVDNGLYNMSAKAWRELKRAADLDHEDQLTLYHITTNDRAEKIKDEGLIPGKEKAIGQDFEAEYARRGTYFHGHRDAVRNEAENLADNGLAGDYSVVTVSLPFTRENVARMVPDEDVSLDPTYIGDALRERAAVAVLGRISKEHIKSVTPMSKWVVGKDFNPNQPRDDHGRWTNTTGTTFAALENAFPLLSDKQSDALEEYTGEGYSEINDRLRGLSSGGYVPPEDIDRTVGILDRLADKFQLPIPVTVWRALGQNGSKKLEGLKPGDVVTDAGFISTSIDPEITGGAGYAPTSRMQIRVPRGSHAIVVPTPSGSTVGVEHEIILPRDSRFKFVGKGEEGQFRFEMIPDAK